MLCCISLCKQLKSRRVYVRVVSWCQRVSCRRPDPKDVLAGAQYREVRILSLLDKAPIHRISLVLQRKTRLVQTTYVAMKASDMYCFRYQVLGKLGCLSTQSGEEPGAPNFLPKMLIHMCLSVLVQVTDDSDSADLGLVENQII